MKVTPTTLIQLSNKRSSHPGANKSLKPTHEHAGFFEVDSNNYNGRSWLPTGLVGGLARPLYLKNVWSSDGYI